MRSAPGCSTAADPRGCGAWINPCLNGILRRGHCSRLRRECVAGASAQPGVVGRKPDDVAARSHERSSSPGSAERVLRAPSARLAPIFTVAEAWGRSPGHQPTMISVPHASGFAGRAAAKCRSRPALALRTDASPGATRGTVPPRGTEAPRVFSGHSRIIHWPAGPAYLSNGARINGGGRELPDTGRATHGNLATRPPLDGSPTAARRVAEQR